MVSFQPDARVVLHTSMGEMCIALLADKAPRTCENFVKLAAAGFYDGLTFHRVLTGFMIQGGCPKGDGSGGPGYTIRPEFNDTLHVRGTVSMARNNDPHSAGSQFFVMHGDAAYLDHKFSAFGRLDAGDEVLEKIATTAVEESRFKEPSQPRFPIYINRVELFGVEGLQEEQEAEAEAAAQAAPATKGQAAKDRAARNQASRNSTSRKPVSEEPDSEEPDTEEPDTEETVDEAAPDKHVDRGGDVEPEQAEEADQDAPAAPRSGKTRARRTARKTTRKTAVKPASKSAKTTKTSKKTSSRSSKSKSSESGRSSGSNGSGAKSKRKTTRRKSED